jgi:hypothetical protein
MAKLFSAKLAVLLAIAAVAFVASACSRGEEADVANPGSSAGEGLSVTLYASPT